MKKLFVYGTLKDGGINNIAYLPLSETKKISEETIVKGYTLYFYANLPFALKDKKSQIKGELYEVSDDVYENIKYMEEQAGYMEKRIKDFFFFPLRNKKDFYFYIINNGIEIGEEFGKEIFLSNDLYSKCRNNVKLLEKRK